MVHLIRDVDITAEVAGDAEADFSVVDVGKTEDQVPMYLWDPKCDGPGMPASRNSEIFLLNV